jgi:tetratricopeptide (TPR) repeat protein
MPHMKSRLPLAVLAACLLPLPLRATDLPPQGEKYALLVGVSRYVSKDLRPLPYSERDVTDLARVLRESGYRADNVVVLTQTVGKDEPRFSPLAERIRAELALLLKSRRPGDTVLVAFAGHGLHFKGDADNYFCPADADPLAKKNLLSLGEVYKQLEGCKAGLKLLLVDACRNDPFQDKSRAPKEFDGDSITRPKLAEPPGGVVAFFSCSEAEKAFEHDDLKHGVFFHFVIEALKGAAATGGDEITLGSLSDYVSRQVADFVRAKYGRTQTPELIGKLRGVFPLVRLGAAVRRAKEYLAKGKTWNAKHEYDKALADFNEALRLDPQNSPAFNGRGWAWYNKREYAKALADYDNALRLDPKAAYAFNNRGLVWYDKKEYAKALADFNEALRLDPKFVWPYNNRGRVWSAKKEYDKALADFDEALRLDPNYAMAFNNRGWAWYNKQELAKALADYEQTLRLDPKHAYALNNRGIIWHDKKEYDRAIKDYDEALRIDPKFAWPFNNRGNVWYAKREYDKALADYDAAVRLDPKYANAFIGRGNVWYVKKEYAKALADYDEALRIDPQLALAFSNRANVYAKLGNTAKAQADRDMAAKLSEGMK